MDYFRVSKAWESLSSMDDLTSGLDWTFGTKKRRVRSPERGVLRFFQCARLAFLTVDITNGVFILIGNRWDRVAWAWRIARVRGRRCTRVRARVRVRIRGRI